MFEKASKLKLRFNTSRGSLSTEDLWDLNLESLDKLAISIKKELSETAEQSFIKKKHAGDEVLQLKLDILVHVINVKLEEKEAKRVSAEKAAKRAQILELMQKKELSMLESKSLDELKQELENLV